MKGKNLRYFLHAFLILICCLGLEGGAHAQAYSTPINPTSLNSFPYNMTGLIESDRSSTDGPNMAVSGSAAVVKNPRVLLSCAHVVYNEKITNFSPWVTDNHFFLKYNDSGFPYPGNGTSLRGYYYFTAYGDAAVSQGKNSYQAFSNDFTAFYAYEPLAGGGFAGSWNDGKQALLGNNAKLIVGYPAGQYQTGDPRKYKMHETGPFYSPFSSQVGDYVETTAAQAVPGNSGGPIFVSDGTNYYYAGAVVAGATDPTQSLAGVYAVSSRAWGLVSEAITALGETPVPQPTPLPTPVPTAKSTPDQPSATSQNTPTIEIYGKDTYIAPSDFTPSKKDQTDFGSVKGSRSIIKTFYVVNNGEAALTLDARSVVIRGTSAFKMLIYPAANIPSGFESAFKIRFAAPRKGKQKALVTVKNNDPMRRNYSFAISANRN